MKIAVLHPGAMGETIVAGLASNGHDVYWFSAGRSRATAARAMAAGAHGVSELAEIAEACELVISVCPPSAAHEQASLVAAQGFQGLYLDANAVAPESALRISELFVDRYIDGGIVGPPAKVAGTTRLYLSGPQAMQVGTLFEGCAMDARVLDGKLDSASALKMCYAAYTKGSIALLLATRALADAQGVADALEAEWELSQPGLNDRVRGSALSVAPKAWRFVDEMHEIAQTFAASELPEAFHLGAANIYQRLADLKNTKQVEVAGVLAELLRGPR